jgi:F0F1-type ATP synthase assembly protein I
LTRAPKLKSAAFARGPREFQLAQAVDMEPMMLALPARPIRITLCWQAILLLCAVAMAGMVSVSAAWSAGLGALIGMTSGLLFHWVASMGRKDSAGAVLLTAFRAEAVKVLFVIIALWAALTGLEGIVAVALIGAFVASIFISSLTIFVRPF